MFGQKQIMSFLIAGLNRPSLFDHPKYQDSPIVNSPLIPTDGPLISKKHKLIPIAMNISRIIHINYSNDG